MKWILGCYLIISLANANTHFVKMGEEKQFPDPGHIYIPGKDTGFAQYAAKSLRKSQKVVLTFDDGPDLATTPALLDILAKNNVKATFFVLTERINKDTLPILQRMIRDGHLVASHHHNHLNSNTKTEAIYREELKKSISLVAQLALDENALHREIYYRFPYGNYGSSSRPYHHLNIMKDVSQELFGNNCINFAFWDIDTVDWLPDMSSDEIATNVLSNIFGGVAYDFKAGTRPGTYVKVKYNITKPLGGGVVLMHDVHTRTVESVPKMLLKFKEKGVQVVALNEVEEYSYAGLECHLL